MNISVLKDYKIFDISNITDVESMCKKLRLNDNEVVMDISRCIIDYPTTSFLTDKLLKDLSGRKGNKELTIITTLNINELLLLHWLFIGSDFFSINDKHKKYTLAEFKKKIDPKLRGSDIKFTLRIADKNGNLIKDYYYGI